MTLNERLLSFAVIIIPCLVIPINGVADAFYYPKALTLWSVSFLLIIASIYNKSYQNITLIPRCIGIALLVFIGSILLSAGLSEYQQIVWDGLMWRHEGVFTLLSYVILFLTGFTVRKNQLFHITKIGMYVGIVISLIGLFQYFGLDAFKTNDVRSSWLRIYSTIGNANWLAGLLLLLLPMSLYHYLFSQRWVHLIAAVLISACLFATGSRGAYMALFFSTLCFGLLFSTKLRVHMRKAIFLLLPLIIGVLIASLNNNYPIKRALGASENIAGAVIKNEASAGEYRWYIYQESIQLLSHNFLFGSGPDTFGEVFNQKKLFTKQKSDGLDKSGHVRVLKAHNEYIQLGITIGVIGMLAFMAITLGPLLLFVNSEDILILLISLGMLAYLIQLFFTNSSIGSASVFWVLLGLTLNKRISDQVKHQ